MEVKFLRRMTFWFIIFFSRLQNYISLYFLLPIRKVSPKQFYFCKNLSEEKFVGIIFWSLEKLGSGLIWSADLHPMLWKVSPLFGIGKQELILGKRCMKQFWAYSTWHLFIRSVSEHLSRVHLWQYHLLITVLIKPKSSFISPL